MTLLQGKSCGCSGIVSWLPVSLGLYERSRAIMFHRIVQSAKSR